jgi:Flp pilus assembly protein TadG
VLPLFLVLLFALLEFMFMFNAQLSLNYATRDAALVAAEAGNNANADCLILQQVDNDLSAPTDDANVSTVHIFSATETGGDLTPVVVEQVYTRGGTTACGALTVPYHITTGGYPYGKRCSDLDRTTCDPAYTSPTNQGVDIIGVRVEYAYRYVTPMGTVYGLLPFISNNAPLWGGAGTTMVAENAMRMEPIL